jgi:hypothetical protein
MSQAVKKDRALDCISNQIPAACSIPIANLKTAYRQNRKIRANPKTPIGNFFAANDPIYHHNKHSNYLFNKEVFVLTRSLLRGGRILLTMRLYTNQDAGNILWEYAFEHLAVFSPEEIDDKEYADTVYISADDPHLNISALLVGFADRDPAIKTPQTVTWQVDGVGTMSPASITNITDGLFNSELVMPAIKGAETTPFATLNGTKGYFHRIEVISGKPANITLSTTGQSFVQGFGSTIVTAVVKDAHGNLVEDSTSVTFRTTGDGFVQTFKGFTKDGVATATVKGGYSSGSGIVIAEVGSVSATTSYNIASINVDLLGVPANSGVNNEHIVTASVTAAGQPASDIFVDFSFEGGELEQSDTKTDANGEIQLTLNTGRLEGTAKLSARADIHNQTSANITKTATNQNTLNSAYLVSDNNGLGNGSYTGFNGATTSVSYPGIMDVTLRGTPSTAWQISLDDLFLPNHEPLLSYRFDSVNRDDTGLHNGNSTNVLRSYSHPASNKYSGEFLENEPLDITSQLSIPEHSSLSVGQPAVAMWLSSTGSGSIVNWGKGAFELTVLANDTIQLSVRTNGGVKTLTSSAIVKNSWLKVSAGVSAREVYLSVDGETYTVALSTETVSFPVLADMVVGKGFKGNLSSLRAYNLNSPELVSLSSSVSGQYDANGLAIVQLQSNNTLGNLQVGSRLANTSVGLRVNGTESLPISLIESQMYTRYVGMIEDTFADSGVDTAEILSKVVTPGVMARNLDVPDKIMGIASDTDIGGPLNVIQASLGNITFRDDLEVLAPHITTIQQFYQNTNQPQMLLATADLLGEAVKRSAKGDGTLMRILQTSLVVLSETISVSHTAGDTIAQSINSRSDFWIWMRFLSMPAKGWAGPVIPIPKPDSDCSTLMPDINIGTALEYTSTPCRVRGDVVAHIINDWTATDSAIAADPRLMSENLRIINNAMRSAPYEINRLVFMAESSNGIVSNSPLELNQANAAFPVIIFRGGFTSIKLVLGIIKKHGANHFINFMQDRTTSRYDALELMAAIGYLELRDADNGCTANCLPTDVVTTVNKNITAWLAGLSLAKDGVLQTGQKEQQQCQLAFQAHGAAHEIMLTAMYHAAYEFGGVAGKKYQVLAADKAVPLQLFQKVKTTTIPFQPQYRRKPDLILEGDGPRNRIWIEAKSNSKTGVKFQPWSPPDEAKFKDRSSYHRQFYNDRVAMGSALDSVYWKDGELGIGQAEIRLKPSSIKWQFQMWEPANRYYHKPIGPNSKQFKKIPINRAKPFMTASEVKNTTGVNVGFKKMQEAFVRLTEGRSSGALAKLNLGYLEPTSNNSAYATLQVGKRDELTPFTLAGELKQMVGDAVKDDILKKLLDDMVDPKYKEWLNGDLSPAQKDAIKAELEAKIDQAIGPLAAIMDAADAITPDELIELENELTEWADGLLGDWLVEEIGEIEWKAAGLSCDLHE